MVQRGRALAPGILLLLTVSLARAATFTVINANDSGAGSLRQAILDANGGGSGPHTIAFAIPGAGVHAIALSSSLPTMSVSGGLTIDGKSQPGYAGSPLIAITCGDIGQLAFQFSGTAGQVQGLSIGNCAAAITAGSGQIGVLASNIGVDPAGTTAVPNSIGISIAAAQVVIGGGGVADRNIISGNTTYGIFLGAFTSGSIEGNYIGTDATGTVAIPNGTGIILQGGGGTGVLIGGGLGRNVISGNGNNGIDVEGAVDVTIQSNFIGVDATGRVAMGNGNAGIAGGGPGLVIGGFSGQGNTVSGNSIGMDLLADGMNVQGNIVGLDASASVPTPNNGPGIRLQSSATPAAPNTIGTPTNTFGPNVIADNLGPGIVVVAGTRNTIRGNAIFDNAALGISLGGSDKPLADDPGDSDGFTINNGQNFPIIETVAQQGGDLHITGTLNSHASTTFDVDFYRNPACARFPHDYVQGTQWIGATQVTTDGNGIAAIDVVLPGVVVDPGAQISSTATDPQGNTSELSQRIVIGSAPLVGAPAGGQQLALDGMLFEPAAAVTIGGVAAANYAQVTNTSAQVDAPALPPGTINDITLVNQSGLSGTLPRGYVSQFSDVDINGGFSPYVGGLVMNGLTAGCGGANYCPTSSVTRQQMAVFLLKGKYGLCYTPPHCTGTVFGDVPCTGSPFDPWIEALAQLQITGGCGGGNYCPTNPVTRQQMAVFLLKALEGSTYTPPACTTPTFGDVPCSNPFAPWIYDLVARGITAGCGGGNYCPVDPVLRQQMAVFLVKTFNLSF